jgi:hypothetical protein
VLGTTPDPAPEAVVDVEGQNLEDDVPRNDTIVLTHDGGRTLEQGALVVRVGDEVVFNRSEIGDTGGGGGVTETLAGLRVEVDDDAYNDLNKPGSGPPGDGDGDSSNVVNEWNGTITVEDRLVIQERNSPQAYDVFGVGDRVRVIWTDGDGNRFVLAEETLG